MIEKKTFRLVKTFTRILGVKNCEINARFNMKHL